MRENTFKACMAAAQLIGGDYAAGYLRGLRRHHHGENFGEPGEHEKWLALDGRRQEMGDGYRDGFAGVAPRGMHGGIGNQNAVRDDVADTQIFIRCKSQDKAAWVKAAAPGKLSEWVTTILNKEALKMTKQRANRPLTNADVANATAIMVEVFADDNYPLVIEAPKEKFLNIDNDGASRVTNWRFQVNSNDEGSVEYKELSDCKFINDAGTDYHIIIGEA
jgi:hypothetical protein